jgi:hypothetical protein
MSDAYVAALLEERRGYVIRGDLGRVAEVDAELARVGYEVPAPVETADAPTGRGRPRKADVSRRAAKGETA